MSFLKALSLQLGVLFCGLWLGFSAVAQENTGSLGSAVFDIPAQNLAEALKAYAAAAGVQVLYESALTVGRRSAAVKGTLTPDAALQALLAGSGLVSRRTDVDAFTIALAPEEAVAVTALAAVPNPHFLGALQADILGALCRNAETRPGSYRTAIQLWLTPAGTIQRATLLSSTGDEHRDAAFVDVLREVRVKAVPPADVIGQPITMVILPRQYGCAGR